MYSLFGKVIIESTQSRQLKTKQDIRLHDVGNKSQWKLSFNTEAPRECLKLKMSFECFLEVGTQCELHLFFSEDPDPINTSVQCPDQKHTHSSTLTVHLLVYTINWLAG